MPVRTVSHFCPYEIRALSDGGCNLVQLTSEVKSVRKHDKAGKPLSIPEWPARSWETRTFENVEVSQRICTTRAKICNVPRFFCASVSDVF